MGMTTFLSQSHRQPLLFDAKYPLTSKNSLPILPFLESNVLSRSKSKNKKEEELRNEVFEGAYLFSCRGFCNFLDRNQQSRGYRNRLHRTAQWTGCRIRSGYFKRCGHGRQRTKRCRRDRGQGKEVQFQTGKAR